MRFQLYEGPDPVLTRLAKVLAGRTRVPHGESSLPMATFVWGRVLPPIDLSVPPSDDLRSSLAHQLAPNYLLAPTLYFSSIDLNSAELALGRWLIGGLACEAAVFNDAPTEGWDWVMELLVHLSGPGSRFYVANFCSTAATFSNALLCLSPDRVAMALVLGED